MGCTELKALEIIDELYSADTVVDILKRHKTDTKSFFSLVNSVPLLTENYIRAHGIRADLFADMVVAESRSDNDPNITRNRMNALIWACSKMKPDKYGERIDLNVTQTVDIRNALDTALMRTRQVLDITQQVKIDAPVLEPVVQSSMPSNEGPDLSIEELLS